jgi:hypothetical protein
LLVTVAPADVYYVNTVRVGLRVDLDGVVCGGELLKR